MRASTRAGGDGTLGFPPGSGAGEGRWLFLKRFWEQRSAVASVSPSSRWLAHSAAEGIRPEDDPTVVELGAGTGPITAELVKALAGRGRLVVVERDAAFCAHLRRRFPGVEVVRADATGLDSLLDDLGIGHVEHVVSALPMWWLPDAPRLRLLHAIGDRLDGTGSLHQVTSAPWLQGRLYRGLFQEVRFRFVPLNLPPGGVYQCRGWRGGAVTGGERR